MLLGNYFFIYYISYCGCVAVQPVRTLDMCKSFQTDEYMSSSSLYRFGQKGKGAVSCLKTLITFLLSHTHTHTHMYMFARLFNLYHFHTFLLVSPPSSSSSSSLLRSFGLHRKNSVSTSAAQIIQEQRGFSGEQFDDQRRHSTREGKGIF